MKKLNSHEKKAVEGIRFDCVEKCVKCCEIPGQVFVVHKDIPAMAGFFNMSADQFIEEKLAEIRHGLYTLDMPDEEPCVYLEDGGCSIYPARPLQCRTFPFWPENMASLKEWRKVVRLCPGIGRGRMYSVDEITDIVAKSSILSVPFIMKNE